MTQRPSAAWARIRTEHRRLLQPLWNALEASLGPRLGARPLLAVSGGPDSRALLEAVARWPRRHEGDIAVAGVDHGTRPEARAEAAAVVGRALALGFEAAVLTAAPSDDDEAALRDARISVLVAHARRERRRVVVTAHHEGDVAEAALLSWLSLGGQGAAMTPAGAWHDVEVLRPFASLSREALRVALFACGATDAFVDPEVRSARAVARRHHLAPLGAGRLDVEGRLAAAARRVREDEDVLRAAAEPLVVDEGGRWFVRLAPPALFRRALRRALAAASGELDVRSSSPAVETLLGLALAGRAGTVHLRGAVGQVVRGGVLVVPSTENEPKAPSQAAAGLPADLEPRVLGVAAMGRPTHDDGPAPEKEKRPAPFRESGDA